MLSGDLGLIIGINQHALIDQGLDCPFRHAAWPIANSTCNFHPLPSTADSRAGFLSSFPDLLHCFLAADVLSPPKPRHNLIEIVRDGEGQS